MNEPLAPRDPIVQKALAPVIEDSRIPQARLRLVELGDCELMRSWKNANKDFFFHKEDISAEQQLTWFAGYLTRPDDHNYLAEELDATRWKPVGILGCRRVEGTVDLYNIMRQPNTVRGRTRIGDALLVLVDAIQAVYREPISCRVLADNPATTWYERLGFRIAERREGYNLLTLKTEKVAR